MATSSKRSSLVQHIRALIHHNAQPVSSNPSTDNNSSQQLKQPVLVDALTKLVSSVSLDNLEVNLPSTHTTLRCPVYFHKVASDPLFEAGLFGFHKAGNRIPLHDHPGMYGFLKAVRGRIAVTSYSWLPSNEEASVMRIGSASGHNRDTGSGRPARFEGTKVVSADVGEVVCLEPLNSNLHVVEALEDGSVFFDLLIPGYKQCECTYYQPGKLVGNGINWLDAIPMPADLEMGELC